MKSIIIHFAKKYIVSAINDLLEKNKDSALNICYMIELWSKRLKEIISCLENISKRVSDDNNLDDEEIQKSVAEFESIVKNW